MIFVSASAEHDYQIDFWIARNLILVRKILAVKISTFKVEMNTFNYFKVLLEVEIFPKK